MNDELLVRGAELGGSGPAVDVRVRDGVVVEVGRDLGAAAGGQVLDCGGGALLPGLHDHHLHLLATAADAASVRVGPPDVRDRAGFARALRDADRHLPPGQWLRATGYHESVAGDLDHAALDRIVPGRPVRVQDRSGARWTLNRAGIDAVGLDELALAEVERDAADRPTGRVHRSDALLGSRLPAPAPPDLAALGARLAGRGVTGVTDTTPYRSMTDLAVIADAVRTGALPQRVVVTGGPELAGTEAPPGLQWGPVKLVIDDADYPAIDDVIAGIETAHRHDRTVAIHCVTRAALALAVAAWAAARAVAGDRVEHGSVVPPDLSSALTELGLTVVTQPGFVAERGDDYLREVDPDDLPHLYPCRSLLDAGITVMGSTDAPYTSPDPWCAIAAAVARRTPSGAALGEAERLSPRRALELFSHDPLRPGRLRRVAVGQPADLCLLAAPLDVALRTLPDVEVVATICRGRVAWCS